VSKTSVENKDSLKPQQRRALIHLAFLGGSVPKATDLKPKLDPKPRKEMVDQGLLAIGPKVGRASPIILQDAGWRWVMENLTSELPPSEQLARSVLSRVAEFLKVNNLAVQDLIHAKRIGQETDRPINQSKPAEQELLRVALELGDGRISERIRLRDLRPRMEQLGYTRAMVDQAIKNLQLTGILSVIPIDLPSDIDDLDRAATIEIAGVPRHAVIVTRRSHGESGPQ
jgi:hypothetical protein